MRVRCRVVWCTCRLFAGRVDLDVFCVEDEARRVRDVFCDASLTFAYTPQHPHRHHGLLFPLPTHPAFALAGVRISRAACISGSSVVTLCFRASEIT